MADREDDDAWAWMLTPTPPATQPEPSMGADSSENFDIDTKQPMPPLSRK